MSHKIIDIVIRSSSAYILLLILGRIIGRKLISRITFFDFMVGVTLGSREQLKAHNIESEKDVFYAGLNAAGNLYISKRLK